MAVILIALIRLVNTFNYISYFIYSDINNHLMKIEVEQSVKWHRTSSYTQQKRDAITVLRNEM